MPLGETLPTGAVRGVAQSECFDACRRGYRSAVDFFAKRHAAHLQSAMGHERRAEFHGAVSEHFQALGDDLQATRARQLAEDHGRRASRERIYARQVDRTEEIEIVRSDRYPIGP